MSKIGKKPIVIPQGVEVKINGSSLSVKGAKGELQKEIPHLVTVEIKDGSIEVGTKNNDPAMWGLYRSLIQNMVLGVSNGFEKVLEFQGVGYKAVVKGKDLDLSLGFSHPILFKAPEGINFAVEKNVIRISGTDKELIGQVAAEIRSLRKPEPYKGSGIRYQGEIIKRKAGKKAVAAGG